MIRLLLYFAIDVFNLTNSTYKYVIYMWCSGVWRHKHPMIITILDHVLPAISHIINYSLGSGTFPLLWRKTLIILLPKKHTPHFLNTFDWSQRPVFIHNSHSLYINKIFFLDWVYTRPQHIYSSPQSDYRCEAGHEGHQGHRSGLDRFDLECL